MTRVAGVIAPIPHQDPGIARVLTGAFSANPIGVGYGVGNRPDVGRSFPRSVSVCSKEVQRLLGLQDPDLDSIIEQGRDRLKSVCFTGSLTARINGETVSRKMAQRLADERGMAVRKSVSKKLDCLVAADPYTQCGKAEKARRYDIPIVAEMEFWR